MNQLKSFPSLPKRLLQAKIRIDNDAIVPFVSLLESSLKEGEEIRDAVYVVGKDNQVKKATVFTNERVLRFGGPTSWKTQLKPSY